MRVRQIIPTEPRPMGKLEFVTRLKEQPELVGVEAYIVH